jgi:hypothetical protein
MFGSVSPPLPTTLVLVVNKQSDKYSYMASDLGLCIFCKMYVEVLHDAERVTFPLENESLIHKDD